MKGLLNDHIVEMDYINSRLAAIQQKCDESEKKLSIEIDGKDVMIRKHKKATLRCCTVLAYSEV